MGVFYFVNSSNCLPLNPSFPHRPRISGLLDSMCASSLLTLAAPPGYGKSQALASYACSASGSRWRTLWVCMPKLDGSKESFWRCFMDSAGNSLRSLARRIAKTGFPHSHEAFETFRFSLEAEARRNPILMVVDNCDRILSQEVSTFLERLIEFSPEQFCLTLTSSSAMTLTRFERLAKGSFPQRLTMDHLKLTMDEAEDMAKALGAPLRRHEIARVLEEIEGWPLAFALICSEHSSHGRPQAMPGPLLPHLGPLLEGDYFEALAPQTRSDLIKLAFPPVFSMEIAREIDLQNLTALALALKKNPFVLQALHPQHPTELMRFHKVYRQFLLSQSFSLSDKESVKARLTAGNWFRSHGMAKEAMECYRDANCFDLALEVLDETPREERKDAVFAQYVIDFLEKLPDSYQGDATIDLSRAFYYMNNLEIGKAEEILLNLVSRLDEADVREGAIKGEAYTALADIDLLQNSDHFADYLKSAARLLPEGSRIQNSGIMAFGNNAVFFASANAPGAVERMVDLVFECAPLAQTVYNCRGGGHEWLFSAEASYLTLNMEEAKGSCYRAIYRGAASEQHDIVCNARYVLARIALFLGDLKEAERHLSYISSYVEKHGLVELYELRDTAWGWFYLTMYDPVKVAPWIAQGEESGYVRWPTPSRRRFLVRALYLKSLHNYHEAIALTAQIESTLPVGGISIPGMLATVLRAECHLRLGDRERAVEALHAAYTRSSATLAILPFVELGNAMRTLIDNARRAGGDRFEAEWLDNVQQRAGSFAKNHASLVETYRREAGIKDVNKISLTDREREVLGFLARGMTREEIGDFLKISVNGVKKHVSGIYNKLGALNRADAVRIATGLGIL